MVSIGANFARRARIIHRSSQDPPTPSTAKDLIVQLSILLLRHFPIMASAWVLPREDLQLHNMLKYAIS